MNLEAPRACRIRCNHAVGGSHRGKAGLVALPQGYVARLVQRLASLLDVPLRYPLRFANSRSSVFSHPLPAGTVGCASKSMTFLLSALLLVP